MNDSHAKILNYIDWLEQRGLIFPAYFSDSQTNIEQEKIDHDVADIVFISPKLDDENEKVMAKNILKALKLQANQFTWLRHEASLQQENNEFIQRTRSQQTQSIFICFGFENLKKCFDIKVNSSIERPIIRYLDNKKTTLLIVPTLNYMTKMPEAKLEVWNIFQKIIVKATHS